MTKRRVALLIEDDADIRELLCARVQRLGFDVETASTGAEGLLLAVDLRPDLVIIDIGLPDIDGWGVIDQLAEDDRTSTIPVIIASVADPIEDASRTVRAHLVKPIKRGALEDAVREALE